MDAGRYKAALMASGPSIAPSGSTFERNRLDVWASAKLLCGLANPEVTPDDEDPEDPDDEDPGDSDDGLADHGLEEPHHGEDESVR